MDFSILIVGRSHRKYLKVNLICLPQEHASGKRRSVLLVLPCGGLFQRTLYLVHTLELFRDFAKLFHEQCSLLTSKNIISIKCFQK